MIKNINKLDLSKIIITKKLYKKSIGKEVIFYMDINDDWFTTIIEYSKKTGNIIDEFMITKKQLDYWYKFYIMKKYIELTIN